MYVEDSVHSRAEKPGTKFQKGPILEKKILEFLFTPF